MKNALRLLPFLLAALAFAFALALPTLAQVAPADPAPVVAAPATDDAGGMTTIVSIALALVSGLVAIWQNRKASTAQKVTESLVLGIEQATKLPQVQEAEKRIKGIIRDKATQLGVQPLLHRAVKDLT